MKMKKTIYSLLAAMLLAGCNNIEENTNNGKEPGSDFDVTACKIASTRVGYDATDDNLAATWEETDQISIYANAVAGATPNRGTLRFAEYKSTDKTQANFKGHFDTDVKTATTVYAYAQYPNVYNQADAIVNDLHYQSGEITGEGSATTHDILFATGEYDPESTAPLNLTFTRKMAIVKFEITLPESITATIPQAVSVTGGGLYNNVTLNLADASVRDGELGPVTISTEKIRIRDHKLTFYAALCPGQVNGLAVNMLISGTRYVANLGNQQLSEGPMKVISTSNVTKLEYDTSGKVTDERGNAMAGVVVSDGYTCVKTDADGNYAFNRNAAAKFVYYTVPDNCEVPVHSASDRTANFYPRLAEGTYQYNFKLTRLANGKENKYMMIVIGDPQVTNAYNPYYESADDNAINKSDVLRFADETMADIKQTIASLPAGTAVYGLTMGDDVQYYGGFNDQLESEIRAKLGSSQMRLFSVIGNHDQDGNAIYKAKWEEAWGPTDYSFDRGDVHYVCFNNVQFYSGASYYQPGELTDAQMDWLASDLQLADKSKMVILNYHIPLTFGNRPLSGATSIGDGHYASNRLQKILDLLAQFADYRLFCGHTHFAVNNEISFGGKTIYERSHAAACGDIWQSNLNIDGVPNGYYVYTMGGAAITDCYYKGTNWDKDKQMSLFRADTDFNGESYAADWNLEKNKGVLVANVFNADSKWKVYAVEAGQRTEMTRLQQTPNQDAFAVGYHKKYAVSNKYSFFSKRNGYLRMNHFYAYTPKDPNAVITVEATDPYGNKFTATTAGIITEPFYNYAHYYKK